MGGVPHRLRGAFAVPAGDAPETVETTPRPTDLVVAERRARSKQRRSSAYQLGPSAAWSLCRAGRGRAGDGGADALPTDFVVAGRRARSEQRCSSTYQLGGASKKRIGEMGKGKWHQDAPFGQKG